MKTEYLPFTAEMLPKAGQLLAGRHACNRKTLPLLPARFEKPQVVARAAEELWKEKHKKGYASTALTWRGLEQARKEGYEVCYTNWISPNLLASRFWPRFGFKDVAYRIAKRVNPMIAWTKDE